MNNQDNRAFLRLAIGLQMRQFAFQKIQLIVDDREMAALRRNDSRPVQHVTVKSNNGNKRGVECEVHTRLSHNTPDQAARVGRWTRFSGAEVRQERIQRGNLRRARTLTEDHSVVIAGNGEDRPVVSSKGLVKLVVI